MTQPAEETRAASRTAVLVCQGRAVAHGRLAAGRFDDPTAYALLRDGEREPVDQARSGSAPQGWADRMTYETLTANAEVLAARTVAIDDAVRERRHPQLVILGAGLDGRAWRLPELAETEVFELDHPASQRDKRARVEDGGLQPAAGSVRFVPVDFAAGGLDAALADAGHRTSAPTTWLWEGVVPYLRRDEVAATARVVGERSAPGSRLVVSYQRPSLRSSAGRLVARALGALARRPDPTAAEPWRSAWRPAALAALLAECGLAVVRDHDLLAIAQDLAMPVAHPGPLTAGRVAVADAL